MLKYVKRRDDATQCGTVVRSISVVFPIVAYLQIDRQDLVYSLSR